MKTVEEIKQRIAELLIKQENLDIECYWDFWKELKGQIEALKWAIGEKDE